MEHSRGPDEGSDPHRQRFPRNGAKKRLGHRQHPCGAGRNRDGCGPGLVQREPERQCEQRLLGIDAYPAHLFQHLPACTDQNVLSVIEPGSMQIQASGPAARLRMAFEQHDGTTGLGEVQRGAESGPAGADHRHRRSVHRPFRTAREARQAIQSLRTGVRWTRCSRMRNPSRSISSSRAR